MPHRFTDETESPAAASLPAVPLFSNHRRVTTAAVGVAVIVLALGVWQMTRNVTHPFRPSSEALKVDFSYLDAEKTAVEKSKQTDTDADGLSDYDEQQVYQTSIYLADTDSDGISDKEEVTKGKDPRCPEGETCDNFNYYGPSPTVDQAAVSALIDSANNPTADGADLLQQALQSGQVDTTELRQALIENGVPASEVAALTDDQIVVLFSEAMTSASADEAPAVITDDQASTSEPNPGSTLTADQRAAFQKEIQAMTGEQLRQTIIASGVDAKLLAGKDDATLREFLLQTLNLGS